MSNQTPPQPPPEFWEALPQIIGKLKNEFLLVTLGILVLVIAIGVFAPSVVDSLGAAFFYLLVVLAWLAYLVGRVLDVWRKRQPPAGSGEPQARPTADASKPEPSTPTPSAQADRGSAAASGRGVANVGDGNVNITGNVQGGVTITQVRDGAVAQGDGATQRQAGGQPAPAGGYDLAAVRDLLLDAFTASELRRLFLYTANPALRPLLQEFGASNGLSVMVDKTIEYCRVRDLLPDLLAEVERANPRQYARYAGRLKR